MYKQHQRTTVSRPRVRSQLNSVTKVITHDESDGERSDNVQKLICAHMLLFQESNCHALNATPFGVYLVAGQTYRQR